MLRNRQFESLAELNRSIEESVVRINAKIMRQYGVSRQHLFETMEKVALEPLPRERWVYREYRLTRVGPDFHVKFDEHWYSVPYTCIGQSVEIRATAHTIEIGLKGRCVASHARSPVPGAKTTNPHHYSPKHFDYVEWTPEAALVEAERINPVCSALLKEIFATKRDRNQQMRTASGLMKLTRVYPLPRVVQACNRALATGSYALSHVRNLLQNKREALTPTGTAQVRVVTEHPNLRTSAEYALKLVHARSSQ